MEKKKFKKSRKTYEKNTLKKKYWECFGGVFGPSKGPKKIISRWLRPKKMTFSKMNFEVTDRFPRV